MFMLYSRITGRGEHPPHLSDNGPSAPASTPSTPSEHIHANQGDAQSGTRVSISGRTTETSIHDHEAVHNSEPVMLRSSATQTDPIADIATRSPEPLSRPARRAEAEEEHPQSSYSQSQELRDPDHNPGSLSRGHPYGSEVSPDRYSTWKGFTKQHDQLLEKRVEGDEIRRDARNTRQSFLAQVRRFLASVQASASQQLMQEYQQLDEAFGDLEGAEQQVEETEDDIVQAESAIRKILPEILGSDRDKTLDMLEREGLFLQPLSNNGTTPPDDAPPSDDELLSEHTELGEEFAKVGLIEDQLFELRQGQDLLRAQDEVVLDAQSLAFLRNYESENDRLSKALEDARYQLELVRDTMQPPLPVSDDEGGYSD